MSPFLLILCNANCIALAIYLYIMICRGLTYEKEDI